MQPPPAPAAAKFHSIIGSLRPTGTDKTTDGVVPYRSAPPRGVDEKIVRSDTVSKKTPRPFAKSVASFANTSALARRQQVLRRARGPKDSTPANLASPPPLR